MSTPAPRPRERRQRPLSPQQLRHLTLLAQPGAYATADQDGFYIMTNGYRHKSYAMTIARFNTHGLTKWHYQKGNDRKHAVITRAGREALRASAAAAGAGGEGAR
jgi:hypothetical protein